MKINQFFIKFCIALTAFCFLIRVSLKAQGTTFTPSHLQAAEDMLISMHIPNLLNLSNNIMLKNMSEMQTQNMTPNLQKKFTKAITAFFGKYGCWEVIKNDIVKIYAAEFSEAETKELTKFYLTPLGQKMLKKQPMLTQKGMDIARQAVESHQDELMKDLIKLEAEKN